MNFKDNVRNFSAFWHCSAGQLFGLRGPDLARGPLIEDPCYIQCVSNEKPDGLALLAIQSECAKQLNIDDMIDTLASSKARMVKFMK